MATESGMPAEFDSVVSDLSDDQVGDIVATPDEGEGQVADTAPSDAGEYEGFENESDAPINETYQVRVGDETIEASLDDLKGAFSRSRDLERQHGEIQTKQKNLSDYASQMAAEYTSYQTKLDKLNAIYENAEKGIGLTKPKIDDYFSREEWEKDPVAENAKMASYHKAREEYEDQLERYKALQEQQYQQNYAEAQEKRARERAALFAAIPEFADPAKEPALRRDMKDTLVAYGLPASELEGINDHRLARIVYDATRYRKIASGVGSAQHRAKTKAVRTSANQPKGHKGKSIDRFRKEGGLDLATQVILEEYEDL